MNDQEIIASIRSGNTDKPIRHLYREFPKIKSLIAISGGSKSEARETFHDSLILLIEKVNEPSFELTSKLTTYLYGINRLLWKNKLRKRRSINELEWRDTLILSNEELGINEETEEKLITLERVLDKISKRCREIFYRFYSRKETMKEIASGMSFSSVNSAKTQKYKCMEQAIKLASVQTLKNS